MPAVPVFLKETLLPAEEVCRNLGMDPHRGLAEAEAALRLKRFGPNRLDAGARVSLGALFLNQFRDFMVLVLLAATLMSALLGEYADALTILAIVLANAFLGLIQEYRAERSLEALEKLAAPRATIFRDGLTRTFPAEAVVPGDLLVLEAGDRVSADARLVTVQALTVDEAALTGESVAVSKTAAPLAGCVSSPGDVLNMVFSGTAVVSGRGWAVVTATGMDTQIGRIAHLLSDAGTVQTPLQRRLNRLGKMLVFACLAVCLAVTLLGFWRGLPLYQVFMAGVSLAVAAIPEGLPAIVTISLALGVQRMIRRRAIVRRLPAVETLGSASVICSDKTGTLTENRMVLRQVWTGRRLFELDSGAAGGSEKNRESRCDACADPAFRFCLEIAANCNNARREETVLLGDPTEVALLEAALQAGITIRTGERKHENPFTPERKMMSVIMKGIPQRLLVKGAPEVVLERCRYRLHRGKKIPLTETGRRECLDRVETMGSLALRTLGMAYRDLPPREGMHRKNGPAEDTERDLIWVGLLGLEDPPRAGVHESIRLCRQAGIRVIMITGDHRQTAVSIARRLEILRTGERVLCGWELEAMDDYRLETELRRVQVFARVSPAHKLRIVRGLKKIGYVVAMTGDGVNDAPAVKEADIGIAMGSSGTDVTREAAGLILSDDNFSTIVAAIEEGRNIYANIRKFIRFLLGCNTGELLTMFLALLIGLPLPLRPLQILWINLVTDGLPAIALGVDSPEKFLMEQPPRRRHEGIFSRGLGGKLLFRGLLIALATIGAFIYALRSGDGIQAARTTAFATLIMTQLIYVFDCRSEKQSFGRGSRRFNPLLFGAVFSSFLLMIAVLYHPFLRGLFDTAPPGLQQWMVIVAAGIAPSLIDRSPRPGRSDAKHFSREA